MQRFFLDPGTFQSDIIHICDSEIIEQMRRVLRMQPGAKFIALNGIGDEFLCEMLELKQTANAKILEQKKNDTEPKTHLTLFQALPKKVALFELVLQKCTEIGVTRFVPLITERTERSELPKLDRMQKILKEAAEQSGRGIIPVLCEPQKYAEAISQSAIVLAVGEDEKSLPKVDSGSAQLFVGPEGGFTKEEIELAREKGATISNLGPRVLRTETAGIVGSSLLLL